MPTLTQNMVQIHMEPYTDSEDIRRIHQKIKDALEDHEKIKVYLEVNKIDLETASLSAYTSDFKLLFEQPDIMARVEKVALVTNIPWLKTFFELECFVMPTLTGKSFGLHQKEVARTWLKTKQVSRKGLDVNLKQFDIDTKEMVAFGAIKSLGGIGIGLLGANYLSTKQSQYTGIAALAGSVGLGALLLGKIWRKR